MADIKHGLSVLLKNIKIAPEKPGVYRMLGEGDKVLYVGKAKNIKKRIVAYSHIENCRYVCSGWFRKSGGWNLSSLKTKPRRC